MQDRLAKVQKLLLEAEDCAQIARLATDHRKRIFFADLEVQLRALAHDIEQTIRPQPSKGAA